MAGFVCCIDEMDSSCNLAGITVPKLRVAKHKEEPIMSERIRIAIDPAKSVFQLVVADRRGKIAKRPRLARQELLPFLAQQPAAIVYISGLKRYLGRISKRGDGYLRSLLVQGARSFLIHAHQYKEDRLAQWALRLSSTRHHNKVAIAVANKLTRIVWAVWTNGRPYDKLHSRAA